LVSFGFGDRIEELMISCGFNIWLICDTPFEIQIQTEIYLMGVILFGNNEIVDDLGCTIVTSLHVE
jgi:hypothetical protein